MNDGVAELNRQNDGIRGVILDYGEVLCHRPKTADLTRLADALGLDLESFSARYNGERLPYDRGDLRAEDYWSKVAPESVHLDESLLRKLREWDVEMWSDINQEMISWLDRLREAGFKTAVLSNMHPDMVVYVRRHLTWLQHIDCPVLSSELLLVKPDPEIYHRCLNCLQLQPSEVVFIDDKAANVDGARSTGMNALQFESVKRLRQDLAALGLQVLP